MRRHPTLRNADIFPVPPGVINLRNADNSPLKSKGYTRFKLTLREITLPVEALVLPSLGPDNMLLDNSIMGAFVLDWQAEELSFKKSKLEIKATHRKFCSPTTTEADVDNCSMVALDGDIEPVPVYLSKKCCVPARHEMTVEIHAAVQPPAETITALVEPRIITADDLDSPDTPTAFQRVIVARTVCNGRTRKELWFKSPTPQTR